MDPYLAVQFECFFGSHGNLKQPQAALTYILIQGSPGSKQEICRESITLKVVLPSAFHFCASFRTSHTVKTTYLCNKILPSWSITCA